MTSGQAGRFIASLNIGRIVQIEMNEGERFAQVVVEPSEYIENILMKKFLVEMILCSGCLCLEVEQ